MPSPALTLRVDWCTAEAARHAVANWHYARTLPFGRSVKVGAWEDGRFVGCVIFARGANRNAASPYGIQPTEIAELVRVALTSHQTPVSRIVSIAIRFLRKHSPGLRLLFSYADPSQGHHGGIYQAGNWTYVGTSKPQAAVMVDGRVTHKRVAWDDIGSTAGLARVHTQPKHKYLMPLDDAMGAQIAPLAKPYPKRIPRAETSAPRGTTTGAGGATPTSALP